MRNRLNSFNSNDKFRLWRPALMCLIFAINGALVLTDLYKALMHYLGAPPTDGVYAYIFICLLVLMYFNVAKMQLQLDLHKEQTGGEKNSR